jgi:hypothetical protein
VYAFIVNRRILTEGLNVIFHQKWRESHVTLFLDGTLLRHWLPDWVNGGQIRFYLRIYCYNKCVHLKSIKIYGICLWINRNLLHHFSFYLYSAQTSNVATWSGLNFKTNVEVVLFKSENLIKTKWWLSVTSIACGNHLGSLSYRQLVSMSCGMQLCHLVLHPPWSIDHLPNIEIHCLSEHIGGIS